MEGFALGMLIGGGVVLGVIGRYVQRQMDRIDKTVRLALVRSRPRTLPEGR